VGRQYIYVGFSQRKVPRSNAYTISDKAIRFRHDDYNRDRARKLISSSTSRHLSTRNISSKSMHAFLSNLANRQTDRQTNRQANTGKKTLTSSFVGGNNRLCRTRSRKLRRVFYFFATQDIARILRKVKENFLAISRRSLVAMAPCQR